MANLFASQLVGLGPHYACLISILETIEKRANQLVLGKDYDYLPARQVSFGSESEDPVAVSMDVFWLFGKTYQNYQEYVSDYFDQAPRHDGSGVASVICGLALDFENLVECSVVCEIDILARLWFFQIWESSARGFEAYGVDDDGDEFYEISDFKLLAHVAHYTVEKLKKFFGYLEKREEE